MKPLPLEEVERIFSEIMDELEPDVRGRVLDKLIMKSFIETVNENPRWFEDNPELSRMFSDWMREKMNDVDEDED
ncbi:MAG: hypothetical protein WA960_14105 [Tunicatimonas sp.]